MLIICQDQNLVSKIPNKKKDHDESSNNLTFIMVFYLFEVIPHRPKNRSYCRQAASNQYLR